MIAEARAHARGETDDDVLAAAAAPAASVHGMTEVPDEVVAAIRAGISDA